MYKVARQMFTFITAITMLACFALRADEQKASQQGSPAQNKFPGGTETDWFTGLGDGPTLLNIPDEGIHRPFDWTKGYPWGGSPVYESVSNPSPIAISSQATQTQPTGQTGQALPVKSKVGVFLLPFGDGIHWHPVTGWISIMRLHAYINDPQIDGILLIINVDFPIELSYASSFFRELKQAGLKKPIVAFIFGDCVGGCYYLTAGANYIVANPQSRIGGIGVSLLIERFRKLKLNGERTGDIETVLVSAGKYKLMLEPQAPDLTGDEKKELQTFVDDQYEQLCSDIASTRNLSKQELSVWADAKIVSGIRAAKIGLIDKTGAFFEALDVIKLMIAKRKLIDSVELELLSYVSEPGQLRLVPFDVSMELTFQQFNPKHV